MFCKHGGDVRGDVIVDDGGPHPRPRSHESEHF